LIEAVFVEVEVVLIEIEVVLAGTGKRSVLD
jgi:hypothetical protein